MALNTPFILFRIVLVILGKVIWKFEIILLCLTKILSTTNGYHILGIFPHAAYSHHVLQSTIMNELLERGHKVVTIGYFKQDMINPNFTQLILPQINLLTDAYDLKEFYEIDRRSLAYKFADFRQLIKRGHDDCELLLNSSLIAEIFEIHKIQPFDLMITETLNTDCTLGIAFKLNIRFIGLSPCALMPYHYDRVSLPDFPSFIPNEFVGYSEVMGFKERLINWIIVKSFKFLYRQAEDADTELLRSRLDSNMPNLREISKNTSILFVNQHYTMSGARPLSPSVVEVGGLHIKKTAKTLSDDWQQLLDNATDGVIVFSWGSVLRGDSLPLEIRNAMINVFSKLKQTVIWKFENDKLVNVPKNIIIRKWIPQREILSHPNVKLFLSHGGLLSINEAIYCGVPMIITPIFGDTFLNAAAIVHRRVGLLLDFEQINEYTLSSAINETFSNPKISTNMHELSYTFRHRLVSPLDTAMWWIEHTIAAPGDVGGLLKSHANNLNWFSYHSYDVITILIVPLIIIIFTIIYLIKLIVLGAIRKCNRN